MISREEPGHASFVDAQPYLLELFSGGIVVVQGVLGEQRGDGRAQVAKSSALLKQVIVEDYHNSGEYFPRRVWQLDGQVFLRKWQ